jgi:hypothetical protein
MSEDCIFVKKPYSICTNNKKKFKFEIIRPERNGGNCNYTFKLNNQDQTIDLKTLQTKNWLNEEDCDQTTDKCNGISDDYTEVMKCIINSVVETFVNKFNRGPGNCSSDKIITQRSAVYIGPDVDMSTCEVSIGQTIDLTSKKICLDINSILANLSGQEKANLIEDVLEDTFKYYNNPVVSGKKLFIEKCKDLLFDRLMNIDMSINAGCSQKITVTQDQNIYFLGTVLCDNSKFDFTQSAIVKGYMRCITEPFMDDLIKNIELKRLFNITQQINKDCVTNKVLVQGCNGKERKFKMDILIPSQGTGKCDYMQNQIITESCENKDCELSDWSDWSPCVEEVPESGIGTQFRTRKLKKNSEGKVIGGGNNCGDFNEKRICYIPKKSRNNSIQNVEIPPPIFPTKKGYEWLLYGPSYLNDKQKLLMKIIIAVLVCLWFYILFK